MKFSIREAYKELENMVTQYFQKDNTGLYCLRENQRLPIYLIGPAGIGKTQIVEQIAKEKKLGFVSYSLVHHTRQSMLGLPVIKKVNEESGFLQDLQRTEYTLSELIGTVYERKKEGYEEGILFLDEANCCPETIQPMLLSFLQSKVLGNSKLPEGWVIVLAGNPPKSIYNHSARQWDGALMDRLRVIELKENYDDFMVYAKEKKMYTAIQLYLEMNQEDSYVCEKNENGGLQLITYRSWENLSDTLYDYEKLNLSITKMMLNEFIKVDRILEKFWDLLQYSQVDYEEYHNIFKGMLTGTLETKKLKTLPMALLYGISKTCYKTLDKKIQTWYETKQYLSECRDYLSEQEHDMEDLLSQVSCFVKKSLKQEIQHIWNTKSNEEARKLLIQVYNRELQPLQEMQNQLMVQVKCYFECLESVEQPILMRFFVQDIDQKVAWFSLFQEDTWMEELQKKYEFSSKKIQKGDAAS